MLSGARCLKTQNAADLALPVGELCSMMGGGAHAVSDDGGEQGSRGRSCKHSEQRQQ